MDSPSQVVSNENRGQNLSHSGALWGQRQSAGRAQWSAGPGLRGHHPSPNPSNAKTRFRALWVPAKHVCNPIFSYLDAHTRYPSICWIYYLGKQLTEVQLENEAAHVYFLFCFSLNKGVS